MVPVPKLDQVIKKFEHFWLFTSLDEHVQAATALLSKAVTEAKKRLDAVEDETMKTQARYDYLMVMVDGFVGVTGMLEKSAQKHIASDAVKAISEYLQDSGLILIEGLITIAAYTKDPIIYQKTVVEGEVVIDELDSSIDGLNRAFGMRDGDIKSWQVTPQSVDSQEMEGGSSSIEQGSFLRAPPVPSSPQPPPTPGGDKHIGAP